MMIETRSARETGKAAALLAGELRPLRKGAAVVALVGDLGAGKTTFVQGFARALGVKENVLSPTFVLMKIYPLVMRRFRHLVHIDCYRTASPDELVHLGFRELVKDRGAIVLIEWADRIRSILPRNVFWVAFRHGGRPDHRTIKLKVKMKK